jgi:predicted transcriptional regulator
MQKKVKITIAPLWVGVVNFFRADGISRMRNKMENGMKYLTYRILSKNTVAEIVACDMESAIADFKQAFEDEEIINVSWGY